MTTAEQVAEQRADDRVGPALLLTIPEAGRLLGVGRTKVYELVDQGRLRRVHLGDGSARVPRASVEALVAELLAEPQTNGSPAAAEATRLPATSGRRAGDASTA